MAKRLDDYTDEEKAFICQYGEPNFYNWECIDSSLKQEYKELEKHFSVVADLMANFYDDLEAYAAMYRNVILIDNEDYDSVFFFSSHYDQIRGYKRRLQSDVSAKARLCRLYLENPAMFSRFSKKYAGVDFYYIKHANRPDVPILQAIRRFHKGKISHVTSIDDLTEAQCDVLIEHIGDIQDEYKYLLDFGLSLPSYDTTAGNAIEFALNRYIPMMLTSGKSDYASRLSIRYLFRTIDHKQVLKDIDEVTRKEAIVKTYRDNNQKLSHESYNLNSELSRIQPRIQSLKEELQKINSFIAERQSKAPEPEPDDSPWLLTKARYTKELLDDRLAVDYMIKRPGIEEEIRKLSAQETGLLQRKDKMEKELDLSKFKVQELTERFAQDVTMLPTFKVLYDQRDKVLREICRVEQTVVNYLWLHYPETMHSIEKYKYGWYDFQALGRGIKSYIYPSRVRPTRNVYSTLRGKEIGVSHGVLGWDIPHRRVSPDGKVGEIIPMADFLTGKYSFKIKTSYRILMIKWLKDAVRQTQEEQERLSREHELRAQQLEKQRKIEEERRKKEEAERVQFNQRHAHYRDSLLQFDETKHQYTYNGTHLQSVTELIESFFPKFDATKYARVTAAREGITTGEVLKRWEDLGRESREQGTAMHKKIELFFQGINSQVDDSFKLFKMFADKIHLNPYRTEWAVFDEDHGVAGTIDFVDFTDGRFTIYDWKRSDKILSNGLPLKVSKYGEKGNYPIENLDNCPYYHYALQLGIYKYILEQKYNIHVSELRLGIFHPSYDKPYVLRMPYLGDEVNKLMNLRSEVVL